VPAITHGTKELVYKEVTLTGSSKDLHRGSLGGAAANPANVLAEASTGVQLLAQRAEPAQTGGAGVMCLLFSHAGRSVDKPLRVRQLPAADRPQLICTGIRPKMWFA